MTVCVVVVVGKEAEEVLVYFRKQGRFQKSQETKAIVDAKIQSVTISLFQHLWGLYHVCSNLSIITLMNGFEIRVSNFIPSVFQDNFRLNALKHSSNCSFQLSYLPYVFSENGLKAKCFCSLLQVSVSPV